jgi:nuclear transport factor 2 (NTF2) superfamily protein
MSAKNVETVRTAHDSWNRRDFPGVVKNAAESLVYTDNARALTLGNRNKFREWTEPQWSPQNRPMVVRAKPANVRGRGLSCFTPRLAAEASRFSYANSEDRI